MIRLQEEKRSLSAHDAWRQVVSKRKLTPTQADTLFQLFEQEVTSLTRGEE
jgi:hypothetical protein